MPDDIRALLQRRKYEAALERLFDVELQWAPDTTAGAAPVDSAASVFTAIQEQLGLKLEPSTGPVDVLVIDRANKPSSN